MLMYATHVGFQVDMIGEVPVVRAPKAEGGQVLLVIGGAAVLRVFAITE
jgi:hypothetical protein